MILTAEDIEAVAVRVAELVRTPAAPREVMTVAEATKFVGKNSHSAFLRWAQKMQVRSCGHGRYSLRSLNSALQREARTTHASPAHRKAKGQILHGALG